jgi:glycosyltransferase involved in cell wall biosynthesis
MTLFTVIIPTKNREAYLQCAVASVLGQLGVDFELIIVNDGNLLQTQFTDRRIRVIDNSQRGAVTARNFGVEQARGRYIAFLDDDDHWTDENHLQLAQDQLQINADFYFSNGRMLFPNGHERAFEADADCSSLKKDNTILISTVCYKINLHSALGNFDEALPYYWDWDWYLRVARANHKLFHQTKHCVNIVVHAQNMSGQDNLEARRANLDLLSTKHDLGKIDLKNHTDFVL